MKYCIPFLLILSFCTINEPEPENVQILEKVFNAQGIREYFFPNLESRNPYYLISNKYVNENEELFINEIPVNIIDKQNLPNQNYIELLKFENQKRSAEVVFYYGIENIEVSCTLEKRNGEWIALEHNIIQF